MDETMIETVELSKRYADGALALDALSLAVEKGQIYCLLGGNGAGKTTALNLLMGFTEPTAGKALIRGIDVSEQPREAKRHVSYLAENVELYRNLTAFQNLRFFARLAGRGNADCAMAMREVGLPERAFGQRVKQLSNGMRQKLGIAIALIKDAPALILDEPIAGLDPQATVEFVEIVKGLRDQGKAILMSIHDLLRAKQIADRVGILKEGRLVITLTGEELRYQDLERVYLDYMRGGLSSGSEAFSG